jgi:hypothetical protein
MEVFFDAGGNFFKNMFLGAISTASDYYKEKNKDAKYVKLIEKFEKDRKNLENKFLEFTKKRISTSTEFQNRILPRYNLEVLQTSIKSIFNEMNISNSIKQEIESNINTSEFSEKLNHFNILILGRAGIGKTTLINSILEFEGTPNELLTGEGTSKTMGEPKGYTSEKVKGLRLWDSQGIDKEKYNIPKVVEDVKKLINEASINNDPDKFIHCIWYCISGYRFEKSESESISELMNIYDDNTLPIIIVYTEAYDEETYEKVCDEVKKVLNDKIDKNKIKEINTIPIVAKKKEIKVGKISTTIEKFGIKPLMDISVKKIILAVNSACFFSFKNKLKKDYEKKIEKKREDIIKNTNSQINSFTSGRKISDITLFNRQIIQNNIIPKLLQEKINNNGKQKVQDILKNFQKFIEDECIKNLPHFFSVCLSESLMEYKKENFEVKEEDNEDDLDLKNEINKYTMNILDKRNEKQKNLKFGGSQEDPIYQQIHKSYLDHIITTASKFIDNKITEEISKLMIKTFNETINNYDEVIQNKVKESMNQQSLDVMKEFNFE